MMSALASLVIFFFLNSKFLTVQSKLQWADQMYTDIKELNKQLDTINSTLASRGSQLGSLMETYSKKHCAYNGELDYDTGKCTCYRGKFGATCTISCEEGGNGYVLEQTHGICYKNVSGFLTWIDAKEHCQNDTGRLFVVKDEGSLQALSKVLARGTYWIGGSVVNGNWRWLDGTEIDPVPAAGQGDCLSVTVEGDNRVTKVNSGCFLRKKTICERV